MSPRESGLPAFNRGRRSARKILDVGTSIGQPNRSGEVRCNGQAFMHAVRLGFLIGAQIFVVSSSHAAGLNPFGATGLPLNQQDYADRKAAADPLRNDDSLPIGTIRAWSNPASGDGGTITLLERFQYDYEGNQLPCRKLKYRIVLRNHSDPYNIALNFCRIADGSWKIM
jgi:hypothetical protein